MKKMHLALMALVVVVLVTPVTADAAEIKALFAGGVRPVTRELTPMFERTSGHTVSVIYDGVGRIKERIHRGETADAIIVTDSELDTLQMRGTVVAGSRVSIAKTGIGVAIRAGAPKPDVSSVEAFKRALLGAKSVGYVDPAAGAASSIPIANMFERLGIDAELRAKAKFVRGGGGMFEAIIKQEVEIGVYIISDIVAAPGIELAGPLPSELQFYISYSAGILSTARDSELAKELIKFLSSPAALPVIKSNGMEPG